MTTMAPKDAVRARDGNRCVRCRMTNRQHIKRYGKSLHVHRRHGLGGYSLQNCETLCYPCHGLTRRAGYSETVPSSPETSEDSETDARESFHLPVELRDALTAYIARTKPKPGKSAVMRAALEEFLTRQGFLPPP